MARHPFDETTWSVRGVVSNLQLNGVYSGIVTGPVHGAYDPISGVMHAFGRQAHHFQGFANMAAYSLDHGATWAVYFNEAHDPGLNQVILTGWSIPHPWYAGQRLYFQVRQYWTKAFLVASGELPVPGDISLFMSENGVSWSKQQVLHSWPAINQIGGNGGAAGFSVNPTVTAPILLTGTGPNGEDAYWMASCFSFDAGGAGNRTTFKASTLWRSIDGGMTFENVKDLEPVLGLQSFAEWHKSTTGRIILVSGGAGSINFTDDGDDLINAVWAGATFSGAAGVRGNLVPMHGGTWLTFSQGTLTGPGGAWVSCDDCENFSGTATVIPQNQTGFMVKIGPSEALIVAPGFSDPLTETVAEYTADGGETFLVSEPWIVSGTGEVPCFMALRPGARPIVMTRGSNIYVTSGRSSGVAQTRTICPLANANIAPAGPLPNCGHPLHVDSCP